MPCMPCGMMRRTNKLKRKYFLENGGHLLRQRLATNDSFVLNLFTIGELKKATNNFHESNIIGVGGYGTAYKGILADRRVVAIKKLTVSVPYEVQQFINKLIIVSQMNHRHLVRLLGCCLETQMPLLVYEYISNGTLYDHIHRKSGGLSLGLRMKIAIETAETIEYCHTACAAPIIHEDLKTSNILLDEKFIAKVSDFGVPGLNPKDRNQTSTLVLQTLGYLDPEYLHSNILTEKSDVYSFGVILVELLTSRVAFSYQKPEEERNLASFFLCSMEEGFLNQILDDKIMMDGDFETIKKVADLAGRCLRLRGEERPTMREVARELEICLMLLVGNGN